MHHSGGVIYRASDWSEPRKSHTARVMSVKGCICTDAKNMLLWSAVLLVDASDIARWSCRSAS